MKQCKSCSNPTSKSTRKYCDPCLKFLGQTKTFFQKFGINENNIQIASNLAKEKLISLYQEKELSLPQISRMFKVNLNSLRIFFSKSNIKTRTPSEAIRLAKAQIRQENPKARSRKELLVMKRFEKIAGKPLEFRAKTEDGHTFFYFDEKTNTYYDVVSEKQYKKREKYYRIVEKSYGVYSSTKRYKIFKV